MTADPTQRPAGPDGPWPPYPAPPPPPRRELGAIIIIAAIIIAAGLVAGLVAAAVVTNRSDNGESTPAAQSPTTSTTVAAEDSSTCQAWQSTRRAMRQVAALPPGWDWDTPNIDSRIEKRNAAVGKALDLFEPKIADEPADVAETAHTFVDEQRKGMRMLEDHTYSGTNVVVITEAETRLSRLCGMPTS